jgi:YcaO-like protein with predicted kinase domain
MGIRVFDQEYAQEKRYLAATHRSRSPAETLEDYMRWMPKLGITRLANVTGLDCIGLPVYIAVRPNARSLATAQGKGLDPLAAKASALMESIELWHAEHIDVPLLYDSVGRMRATRSVVDVTKLALQAGSALHLEAPMLWIEGYDLLGQAPLWLPYECATMNCVMPPGRLFTFAPSSNGLASGNHLLEAVVHGLCEVIERDALTLWELAPEAEVKRRQIDLSTVTDAGCVAAIEKLRCAGVDIAAWDITSDLGVPAYACEIFDALDRPQWRRLGVFGGYGCHLAPEVALMRAVSEAIQSRLAFISGSRDDLFYSRYETRPEEIAAHARKLREPPPAARFDARQSLATPTFEGDLLKLLGAVRSAGGEHVIVVNLEHPEIGIPVVKVVVPGMEARLSSLRYQPGERARAAMAKSGGPRVAR